MIREVLTFMVEMALPCKRDDLVDHIICSVSMDNKCSVQCVK